MRPGVYPVLDIGAYHRSPGISKTGLVKLDEAASVYRHAIDHRDDEDESKALRIGKAFHCAMEGKLADLYIEGPNMARNSKGWKEFESQHPGKVCLQPEETETVRNMKIAVEAYGPAQELLSKPGYDEISFYWIDPRTGRLCKCRPDRLTIDFETVIDHKTARDVSHNAFRREAYERHYFASAAMTMDGIYRVTGVKPKRYIFLTVRSTPVHLVAAYEATKREIALGRGFVRRNLARLKFCEESGSWPGLPEEILPLGLPSYAPEPAAEDYEFEELASEDDVIAQLDKEFEYVAC